MKISIDTDANTLEVEDSGSRLTCELYSREAFEIISRQWTRVGWNQKYSYTFSWLGRPIIQMPEDMVRLQEVIYRIRPDVIIETGVAHGGSLVFCASLCKLLGRGRVIGVDVDIRPKNRESIEQHDVASLITLIEGDSVSADVVENVRSHIKSSEVTLVILDSDHSFRHVRAELEAYAPLVTEGSYIAATDGVMRDLHDVPRGHPSWKHDNPIAAVVEFLSVHGEFAEDRPAWPFNESELVENVTHWPRAWLRRRRD